MKKLGITTVTWLLCVSAVLSLAQTQAAPKPFTKDDIVKLLLGSVSPKRVGELTHERGIDFQITTEVESQLRAAGADDELIAFLRELALKVAILVVTTTPGGAQVFIDDELIARTSSEGRLKISRLIPGPHKLRVASDGYRDNEQTVRLIAGEVQNIKVNLTTTNTTVPDVSPEATNDAPHALASQRPPLSFVGFLAPSLRGSRWISKGTLTIADGRLEFKDDKKKRMFDVPLSEILVLNESNDFVVFETHNEDNQRKYWFWVRNNGKDKDANRAAAMQLFMALKTGSW